MRTSTPKKQTIRQLFKLDGITITKPIREGKFWVSRQHLNGHLYGTTQATKRRSLGNYYKWWFNWETDHTAQKKQSTHN